MNRSKWDQRVERADALTAAHPFAAEVLQFYKRMALFQQALYSDGEKVCGNESGKSVSGLLQQDLHFHLLLPKFGEFLSTVETCAPQLMAEFERPRDRPMARFAHFLLANCVGFSVQSRTARSPAGVDFSAASSRVLG